MFEDLGTHWPFLASALVIAALMQGVKTAVPSRSPHQRWFKPLLPVIPVALGIGVGFIAGIPVPLESPSRAAVILYFALSGVASTWAFDVMKKLLAVRGVDIDTLRPLPSDPAPDVVIPRPPPLPKVDR